MKLRTVFSMVVGALLMVAWAAPARADRGVFLNGVRVNGLANQSFKGCQVRFDATGNIFITAPGFKVKAIPQGPAAPPPPAPVVTAPPRPVAPPYSGTPTPPPRPAVAKPAPVAATPAAPTPTHLTRRYFIVTMSNKPGHVQYDVDIYFNGKWARKVKNRDRQLILEVTKKLKPGKNVVHFAATKNYDRKPRLSTSSSDFLRVILGSGNRGGGTVSLTENFAEFKVTADKTGNFHRQLEVTLP